MKTDLYNFSGKVVGDIELPDAVFAHSWNADLVHQALLTQVANRRQTTAHTKNRAEVSGGGKKPWRQKGTGRARQGSIRSPIWRGGGVAHGPRKEKVFENKINRKMLRGAIHSVLSKRLKLNELKVVDSFELATPKTKEINLALKNFFKDSEKISVLLVVTPNDKKTYLASRNIPKVKSLPADSLNVEDLLKYKNILVDQKAAMAIK